MAKKTRACTSNSRGQSILCSVWIAGEEGVSHIKPDSSWFDAPREAPPPRITRLETDGRTYLRAVTMPNALPANTDLLRIEVGSLDTPQFRDYPFRYRLKPLSNDWKSSRDGALEFRRLPENHYTLEVAYSGNGPSATLTFPFRIGTAGASLPWRWLIGLPLAGGAAGRGLDLLLQLLHPLLGRLHPAGELLLQGPIKVVNGKLAAAA
jgi:hypothetical protein